MPVSVKTVLIITILFSPSAFSKDSGDAIMAALGVISAFMNTEVDKGIPSDQIRGRCRFNNTICPGAEIILRDTRDKELRRLTIDSTGEFVFASLPKAKYRLELNYARYDLTKKSGEIQPGTFTQIDLERNKKP